MLERAKSSIYRTGIFGNFFFGGGNFAFSKREFPVALALTMTCDGSGISRTKNVDTPSPMISKMC